MSKVIVIGDVHQHHQRAEELISSWEGPVIFLGDYFDQFSDTPDDAIATARWLKDSLCNPKRIHLTGNHDIHYMLPIESNMYCSGYTPEKHKAISSVLTNEDWRKLNFFHAENNCWFSHAGITYHWFSHPVLGLTEDTVKGIVAQGIEDIRNRIYNGNGLRAINAADHYRGGWFRKGGLLWNDWRNSDFIPGITQVVGHTPRDKVKCAKRKGGININVDTHLKQAIILNTEDSSFEIIQ